MKLLSYTVDINALCLQMDARKFEELASNYNPGIKIKVKQLDALISLASGNDTIVSLPVGYGKSLIYHLLPQVLGSSVVKPVVVVISPLNVIQKDQLSTLRQHGVSACRLDINTCICETTDMSEVSLSTVAEGKYSLIFGHPETFFQTEKGRGLLRNEVLSQRVVAIVIDEVHIIEKWGAEFRSAFKQLQNLRVYFPNAVLLALSGTLTIHQKAELPLHLGMRQFSLIECSPDRPNIFLEKKKKEKSIDVLEEYEKIIFPICDELCQLLESFPITLLFVPIFYMSEAVMYLRGKLGMSCINNALYSAICSGQDPEVIDETIADLKKDDPRIRLILTTSIAGMGFDPTNVSRVIHTCPPRNISQYLQEIGRAGRRGQSAIATLHYSNRDIARNLPGIQDDIIDYCRNESSCMRNMLLSVFGFQKDASIQGSKCCSFCKSNCASSLSDTV